jgi:4-hydroxy-3-polyprenylbenzoate decarboxylase
VTLPVVVGISGASGAAYGLAVLELLQQARVPTHLVITEAGARVLQLEAHTSVADVLPRATQCWNVGEIAAPIASGTFQTAGMIVAPCSIRTLSAVACCRSSNLLERAADVTLKERRPLVLLVRETPLHAGHLRLMHDAAVAGATIMPPVPPFYAGLQSIEDLVLQTAARAIGQLGIQSAALRRWGTTSDS